MVRLPCLPTHSSCVPTHNALQVYWCSNGQQKSKLRTKTSSTALSLCLAASCRLVQPLALPAALAEREGDWRFGAPGAALCSQQAALALQATLASFYSQILLLLFGRLPVHCTQPGGLHIGGRGVLSTFHIPSFPSAPDSHIALLCMLMSYLC